MEALIDQGTVINWSQEFEGDGLTIVRHLVSFAKAFADEVFASSSDEGALSCNESIYRLLYLANYGLSSILANPASCSWAYEDIDRDNTLLR